MNSKSYTINDALSDLSHLYDLLDLAFENPERAETLMWVSRDLAEIIRDNIEASTLLSPRPEPLT